jgi:methyl-accepting chemotaxis protein
MRAKENINSMAKELDESMQKVLRVLDSYTNSNYKDKIIIQEKLKAQLKEVMISINKLGITLANSAKESYQKGEALKSEVNTLNSSLTQLVKKSDEQAKSVSKTLKFVQDINELTKNNTKSALSMSELGNRVKSLASKGKELTKSSTKSMDEIDEVTKKISDSIEIIEQISFQINILSLNAAVEAATAGEFGKGFAVVASEVRNLASKTAQASEDIKAIIDAASLKVQEGKINSHNMQEGYSELNSYINETIRLIESVVNSSKEQLSGTEEISQNIDTIEKITKENTKEANRVKEISQNVEVVAIELLERAKESSY